MASGAPQHHDDSFLSTQSDESDIDIIPMSVEQQLMVNVQNAIDDLVDEVIDNQELPVLNAVQEHINQNHIIIIPLNINNQNHNEPEIDIVMVEQDQQMVPFVFANPQPQHFEQVHFAPGG